MLEKDKVKFGCATTSNSATDMRPLAILLVAATTSAALSPAAKKWPPEKDMPAGAKEIDRQCTAAVKLDDAHKVGFRVLADVSDAVLPQANDGSGKWTSFSSPNALKRYARKNNAPNTQAFTWSAPGGTFIAALYFQSDTGDWTDIVDYCFRVDGTLARSAADIVNLAGGLDGERTVYYAADGHVIFAAARSLDEHGKPRADVDLNDLDAPPFYPTVKSLPFNSRGAPPSPASMPDAGVAVRNASRPADGGVPPPSNGHLDPAAVASQVRGRLGKVKHCYERELAKDRSLSGRVVLHWTIDLTGATRDVSIESATIQMGEVGSCIIELVKHWRFEPPPTDGNVEVSFPFVFQSSP